MKILFNISKVLFVVLILGHVMPPGFARSQSPDGTTQARGFVIIQNDLAKVNEEGLLVKHVTELDAELNIQAQVSGTIKIGEDGFWLFKKGQTTVKFEKTVMYLRFDKKVPLTIEVLFDLLDEKEETKELPILIKAENDETGRPYKVRIFEGRLVGLLLPPDK